MTQKHLANPLDCLIEWCENNIEIKEKYPLIINNAKDELKRLRKLAEKSTGSIVGSCCKSDNSCKKSKKVDDFFKLDLEENLTKPFQEFKSKVEKMYCNHTDLRYGQAIMNVLWQTHPKIYQEITGTELDSFYIDEKSKSLLKYLEDKING